MSDVSTSDPLPPLRKPDMPSDPVVPDPPFPRTPQAKAVDDAIINRRSCRAFKPDPVSKEMVEHLIRLAQRAPSGTNCQPWNVWVCTGAVKDRLCAEIQHEFLHNEDAHAAEYTYSPSPIGEPYISRRRQVGWNLYGLLGIRKGEYEKTRNFHKQNHVLFGAPVGLFFSVEKHMQPGNYMDTAFFMENLMIAASGHGLATCPQVAFSPFHEPVRKHLGMPDDHIMLCGMALGYPDDDALVNELRTHRAPFEEFAHFAGFDD